MSNLRLINETSFSAVSSATVTDVFSSDFDIYNITISDLDIPLGYITWQMVNSSGSAITTASYDRAGLFMHSTGAFEEGRTVNAIYQNYLTNYDGVANYYGGVNIWLFNPYSSSSYTFSLVQGTSQINKFTSSKSIGVLKQTTSITGFKLIAASGNTTGVVRTYGLRVDS